MVSQMISEYYRAYDLLRRTKLMSNREALSLRDVECALVQTVGCVRPKRVEAHIARMQEMGLLTYNGATGLFRLCEIPARISENPHLSGVKAELYGEQVNHS